MPVYKILETKKAGIRCNEKIFNALVEKIEILTPTHFVFKWRVG